MDDNCNQAFEVIGAALALGMALTILASIGYLVYASASLF